MARVKHIDALSQLKMNFSAVGVRSPLKDYELAYWLNIQCGMRLVCRPEPEDEWENDVVWEHDFGNNNIFIARGQKYPMDYLGGGFPDYTLGDVDFNGEIGILDLLYIADMAQGVGYESSPAADINEDGDITISDVILILQQIINN